MDAAIGLVGLGWSLSRLARGDGQPRDMTWADAG